MVNYCCVVGCGRNSKVNKQLNFFSLPKQKQRQIQWLKAAGKENLLDQDMEKLTKILRFCSRHFSPSSIKNKHLHHNAVPSIRLPSSLPEEQKPLPHIAHEGIFCDVCEEPILGFRYKCVTCDNYDLCQKCEMLEAHEDHFMLRIPKSLKFKSAEDLINKWRQLFESEHITVSQDAESNDSDDEPITKYIKTEDNMELSDKVKNEIRNEIKRAIKAVKKKEIEAAQTNFVDLTHSISTPQMIDTTYTNNPFSIDTKNQEIVNDSVQVTLHDVKNEANTSNENVATLSVINTSTERGQLQPVLYLKINDVLTQLMLVPNE